MTQNIEALFSKAHVGSVKLENRFVMAPMTRCRAPGNVPNDLMATHYGQRASAGLIITECTLIEPNTSAFGNEPGLYTTEQVEGWKKTTAAVHAKGGKIFNQIWHAGRAVHPALNPEHKVVSSSATSIQGEVHTPDGKQPYVESKALSKEEIQDIVESFRKAAANAIAAGFDGIEIHGANGYLIDQFLRDSANQRTDEYGGSLENRARFLFEILDAVSEEIGADRVGLRLSPLNSYNDMRDSNPLEWIEYLSKSLNKYSLAYLHVMRADFFGVQTGDVLSIVREHFEGTLIVNMGYSPEEAAQVIESNQADLVAFGTGFISNPDFPERVRQGADLNPADESTFYTPGEKGYTDYPALTA